MEVSRVVGFQDQRPTVSVLKLAPRLIVVTGQCVQTIGQTRDQIDGMLAARERCEEAISIKDDQKEIFLQDDSSEL